MTIEVLFFYFTNKPIFTPQNLIAKIKTNSKIQLQSWQLNKNNSSNLTKTYLTLILLTVHVSFLLLLSRPVRGEVEGSLLDVRHEVDGLLVLEDRVEHLPVLFELNSLKEELSSLKQFKQFVVKVIFLVNNYTVVMEIRYIYPIQISKRVFSES